MVALLVEKNKAVATLCSEVVKFIECMSHCSFMNDGFFNIQILGYEDKEIRAPRESDAYCMV